MFEGSCHCGAIRFRVDAVISELTTCDCSLCVKRNAVMAKIPEHALTVVKGDVDTHSPDGGRQHDGRGSCRAIGMVWTTQPTGRTYSTVNRPAAARGAS